MTKDEEIRLGIKAYGEASLLAAATSTPENLAAVEENYRTAFNKLRESPDKGHRLICAECLDAVARILETRGRPDAADDLRRQAEVFRRPRTDTQ